MSRSTRTDWVLLAMGFLIAAVAVQAAADGSEPGPPPEILALNSSSPGEFSIQYFDNYNYNMQQWVHWGDSRVYWNDEYRVDWSSGMTDKTSHFRESVDAFNLRYGFSSLDGHSPDEDWNPLRSNGDIEPHHYFACIFTGWVRFQTGDQLMLASDDDSYIFLDDRTAWGQEILSIPHLSFFETRTLTIPASLDGYHRITVKFAERAIAHSGIEIRLNGSHLTPVDLGPTARDDHYAVDENQELVVPAPGVLANDTDPGGGMLMAVQLSNVRHGTLDLDVTGAFRYTPDPGYFGSDSFTYLATNGQMESNETTVLITVNLVNEGPVARGDMYFVDEDDTLDVASPGVLDNDSDPDGDPLRAILVGNPSSGTLTLNSDGSFIYTPDENVTGVDTFTYKANDGSLDSRVVAVTITIRPVNDPPVADDQSVVTDEDVAVAITCTASDVDGDTLTYSIVSGPNHGTLNGAAPDVTYTPDANYNGPDAFEFTANDGKQGSDAAMVSITVNPVNDPPVVGPITVSADEVGVDTPLDASAAFSDPDAGDTHVAQWDWGDGEVTAGSVDETNGSVTGTHTYTDPGYYTITLTVTDSAGASGEAVYQYIVVYGSSGDFVTGGGWILAPKGSYPANPFLTGVANFGFVVKYLKGDDVPKGQTQFNFRVGRLNFHSTAYEWLVVSGSQARFKGTGRINREEGYGFQVSVTDGQVDGGVGVDRFRIRIWNAASGETVFDNGMGGGDDALGGGDIVIHKRGAGDEEPG